jgi:hypothetical protein
MRTRQSVTPDTNSRALQEPETGKPLYLTREVNGRLRMRRIIPLILLAASIAAQARQPRPVSIEEFERILASNKDDPDGKVAKNLSGFRLTERASSVRLARWETQFPGKHCHEALLLLADASAFLTLPTTDAPANAQPDVQTQKEILLKAINYVNTTITRLPNLYATRKTEHFEDTPALSLQQLSVPPIGRGTRSGAMPGSNSRESAYVPIHDAGKSSTTIRYLDGQEVLGSKKPGRDPLDDHSLALTTHGEFGPILIVVLQDAIKNQIRWGHWEQSANGISAVFRYGVAHGQSNYMVALPHGSQLEKFFPAYHGEIAIDPSNGDILRITVIADFEYPNEDAMSSILVEYAPVSIGGTPYICPVRSVALAKIPLHELAGTGVPVQTQLNDVAFTEYHLFRSESRILTGAPEGDPNAQSPPK